MTHSAETQCLSGERERAEEKIPHIHFWLLPAVAEVLTAIALQRSCSCAAGGGTRTIDKGSLCHPLPGYPGAGDKPRAGGGQEPVPTLPEATHGLAPRGAIRVLAVRGTRGCFPFMGNFYKKSPSSPFCTF